MRRENKLELKNRTQQFAIIFVSLSKAFKKIIIMTDIQLYTKLAGLPLNLKNEVADFIDFLKYKSLKKSIKMNKRIAGQAKGLIAMKDNFDDPIVGFMKYM